MTKNIPFTADGWTTEPLPLGDKIEFSFWTDSNEDVEILEANEKAQDNYGHNYGSETIVLSKEHIQALVNGKMLAWNDREYTTFLVFSTVDKT